MGLFVVSFGNRLARPAHEPDGLLLGIELVATVVAVVTGWLGGELVQRLRVGVDDGAHLDAPSSLSTDPAVEVHAREALTMEHDRQLVGSGVARGQVPPIPTHRVEDSDGR